MSVTIAESSMLLEASKLLEASMLLVVTAISPSSAGSLALFLLDLREGSLGLLKRTSTLVLAPV